jgi:peptide deformylase
VHARVAPVTARQTNLAAAALAGAARERARTAPVRPILLYGDPRLTRECDPVEAVTGEVRALAESMVATLRQAKGMGLAAPQVGRREALAVVQLEGVAGGEPIVLVNPVLSDHGGRHLDVEGCLSIPGAWGPVARSLRVVLRATDLAGRTHELAADGLLARVLQHEVDHLRGTLFLDHLTRQGRRAALRGFQEEMERRTRERLSQAARAQRGAR